MKTTQRLKLLMTVSFVLNLDKDVHLSLKALDENIYPKMRVSFAT
jgi:hypothetical protein